MDALGLPLEGTCAFRLMPTDELVDRPSTALATRIGEGLSLAYAWQHAEDGPQRGALVVGGPDDQGGVVAAWGDSWHQSQGLMRLTGRRNGDRWELAGTYAEEWGWTITVDLDDDGAALTMCNVVPEAALAQLPPDGPAVDAGPYDVMVARWFAPTQSGS